MTRQRCGKDVRCPTGIHTCPTTKLSAVARRQAETANDYDFARYCYEKRYWSSASDWQRVATEASAVDRAALDALEMNP